MSSFMIEPGRVKYGGGSSNLSDSRNSTIEQSMHWVIIDIKTRELFITLLISSKYV